MGKTRINHAHPRELLEIPEFDSIRAEVVVQHRVEHGPISSPAELAKILGAAVPQNMLEHIDFAPVEESATESAGG
ncbi:MAG TPA: helix-hairpin-helix domain-containing protein [Methylomirabilota bacterium]|jgi:DNA uptake protein ComE-like DNA-binding protein|nr:helix-hairpin-helix domain-containing protein [Methylomirabilota bacterium]